MSAETDLLPMPKGEAAGMYQAWSYDQMRDYARANVARAVAPLQAEVEALRAEVKSLQTLRDVVIENHGYWKDRAERLEEALRLIESAKDRGFGIDYARGVAQSALLSDQEEGHEQ